MPIVSIHFERIGIDLVGPSMVSSGRHCFILVVKDYATHYLEAMPLCMASAAAVAQELATLFTRVGFPKQIVTNKETAFI